MHGRCGLRRRLLVPDDAVGTRVRQASPAERTSALWADVRSSRNRINSADHGQLHDPSHDPGHAESSVPSQSSGGVSAMLLPHCEHAA